MPRPLRPPDKRRSTAPATASSSNASDSTKPELSTARYTLNLDRHGGTHALLVRLVPPGSRVLDVGCATGYLGGLLVAKGCTVVGIEAEREAVRVARTSGAYLAVHEIDLDDATASLPSGPFDVVLCADVLEHLRHPQRTLRLLCRIVTDDGRVIVSLPNIAHLSVRIALLAGRFRYVERGILDRTHLHFYTYDSARALVEEAGLRVESVLAGSNRFGEALSFGPRPVRQLRGLLAYNIVLVARPEPVRSSSL